MTENQYGTTITGDGQQDTYECECLENKKYRVVFDGAQIGQYVVEYCQKCFDQDDKAFLIRMEVIV